MGLFLDFLSYSVDAYVCPMPLPHCFDDQRFVVTFELGIASPPTLFFFKFFFLGPLRFPMNYRISFSISAKKAIGILIGIVLDL